MLLSIVALVLASAMLATLAHYSSEVRALVYTEAALLVHRQREWLPYVLIVLAYFI